MPSVSKVKHLTIGSPPRRINQQHTHRPCMMGQLGAPFLPASQDSSANTRCTIFDTGYYNYTPWELYSSLQAPWPHQLTKGERGDTGVSLQHRSGTFCISANNLSQFNIKQLVLSCLFPFALIMFQTLHREHAKPPTIFFQCFSQRNWGGP